MQNSIGFLLNTPCCVSSCAAQYQLSGTRNDLQSMFNLFSRSSSALVHLYLRFTISICGG